MIDIQSLLPEYSQEQFDSRHRLVIVAVERAVGEAHVGIERVIVHVGHL